MDTDDQSCGFADTTDVYWRTAEHNNGNARAVDVLQKIFCHP